MFKRLSKNVKNIRDYAEAIAERNIKSSYNNDASYKVDGANDNNLKCVPEGDYIYNGVHNNDLLTASYLDGLSVEEKNKLILELQEKNKSVREENEQFRQKNFIMYMELRKLGVKV